MNLGEFYAQSNWTSRYDEPRPIGNHKGLDIARKVGTGTPVPALRPGVVSAVVRDEDLGWYAIVRAAAGDHDGYSHILPNVSVGQAISQSSTLGTIAGWGDFHGRLWEGPHLHLTRTTTTRPWVGNSNPEPLVISTLAAWAGGGSKPFPNRPKGKKTVIYHKAGTTPFLFALAGDSPGTPANWLETTDQGLANDWLAQIVGPGVSMSTIGLNDETWEAYKKAYTSPLSTVGGTSGSSPSTDLSPVLDAVAEVPEKTRAEFAKNPLK